MADEELATKAPESDAAESLMASEPRPTNTTVDPSPIPGDTTAHTGASMGDHCTTDRPIPANSGAPAGEISTLNNIECYISKPSSYPSSPCKLLLLLTGGTGLHSKNNQLQADAFADRGYVVVMPDQFGGDAAPNSTKTTAPDPEVAAQEQAEEGEAEGAGILERIKMGAAETAKSFLIDMWLARHTAEKTLPIIRAALTSARETFADAVANGGGVYGVGYCFGAKYVLLLLGPDPEGVVGGVKADEEAKEEPELKVGAIAHGTLVTAEDIEGVRKPVCMACVANDQLFPDHVREQGKAALELIAVEHEIKVFDGVPHGFAVLGDYAETNIKASQKEAFELMVGWLDAH